MTMITPSYLGETIEYSSLHACRSTLEDPTQRFAAHMTHVGLYALLVAQPLVGWVAMSTSGAPVTVFGQFALPPIGPEDRVFSEQLFALHGLIGFSIAGLIAAHVGAALYHHVVRRDRVLMRMITG